LILLSIRESRMGGLVLDIVVGCLYKSFVRIVEYVESARWKRATASIVESSVLDSSVGCTVVKIRYQVDAEENPWVTEEEIPLSFAWKRKTVCSEISAESESDRPGSS
jgi:hypothetical protein